MLSKRGGQHRPPVMCELDATLPINVCLNHKVSCWIILVVSVKIIMMPEDDKPKTGELVL
jgi:hypothetical protein